MSNDSTACPISFEPKIDGTILRLNAIVYMIIMWSAVLLNTPLLMLLLMTIFISKNININTKCLLDYASNLVESLLHLPQHKIDPAPKKLANAMGLLGSTAVFATLFFDLSFYFVPVTIMSIAFSLEIIFDYCIGCKIYTLWQMLQKK